ncbi:hypothetical protein RIR_jg7223.t1 [Rhizophagus irregularis DAOM 181602=DAOM 197198]|uniref:Uncharacterized protein n=2 Tax=Rhizophagus irregularis TaxID=588596 RepID=A0A2N1NV73_9GLOM|nr:hypothetical protein RhiirC2_49734 [Rhizophagus irregularis]GBC39689.1 hypothetical protein RIR_jg7223.t1 [Rhizophagus irregularis DAOM 181602=DAOM 197198]
MSLTSHAPILRQEFFLVLCISGRSISSHDEVSRLALCFHAYYWDFILISLPTFKTISSFSIICRVCDRLFEIIILSYKPHAIQVPSH